MRKPKKIIIVEAIQALTGDQSFTDEQLSRPISLSCSSSGSRAEFESSVANISNHKSRLHKTVLVDAAMKFVKLPKKGAEKEEDALRYLKSKFGIF